MPDMQFYWTETPDGAVLTDPDMTAGYRQDWAADPNAGTPIAVVRATCTEDVQAVGFELGIVEVLAYGLPPRYDPSAEDSRELAAGRMLILSGFPAGMGNEAFGRKSCLALNEQAAAIAAASQGTEGLRPPNPPAAP